jgi:AraC-like DNA-binding protein
VRGFGINDGMPRQRRREPENAMHKLRQVRLNYPDAFVELALALQTDYDKRDVAMTLGMPLSTIYRWAAENRGQRVFFPAGWTNRRNPDELSRLAELVTICEREGFTIGAAVSRLAPAIATPPGDANLSAHESHDFLRRLPNQFVIGKLSFPRGAGIRRNDAEIEFAANGTPSNARSRVYLAKMEIDQHYYTKLSCESLADLVGMSRFNFIKAFKAAFAVSPYQYLNQVRVDHAKHMLALTGQPMHMIAASVGFGSASSLSRAFKRFAGASPANIFHKVAPAMSDLRAVANF